LQKRATITGGGNQKDSNQPAVAQKATLVGQQQKQQQSIIGCYKSISSNCKHDGINQLMVATATTASRQKGSNIQLVTKKVANFNRWQQKGKTSVIVCNNCNNNKPIEKSANLGMSFVCSPASEVTIMAVTIVIVREKEEVVVAAVATGL